MVWKMSECSDPSALIWCCEFGNILNMKRTLKCWLWCVRAPVFFAWSGQNDICELLWDFEFCTGKWRCRMKAVLLQIHIMLSFHLSPWEHKGVHTVLSWVYDSVNNNSWTCWGWCQFLDPLRWHSESLLLIWSCATCGWSTGHSGLQGRITHRWSWSCVREDLAVMSRPSSLHSAWVVTSEKAFCISTVRFISMAYQNALSRHLFSSLDNPDHYRFQSTFRYGSLPITGRKKSQA